MPTGADIDTTIQGCTNAQQCFQLTGATLTGTTFNIPCPGGVPTTQLFVNTVNGYYANFSINEAYWEFQYNGQSSAIGLSCQSVHNGDTIKLQVHTTPQNNNPINNPQTTSTSSTPPSNTGPASTTTNTQTTHTNTPQPTTNQTQNTTLATPAQTNNNTNSTTLTNEQPNAPTGLFTAVTNNALPIAILVLLLIAGYATYKRKHAK